MKQILRLFFTHFLLVCATTRAQEIDIEGFKKANFKLTGGINASSIYYDTDAANNSREPFTYMLSGNINISIFNFSMPLSYAVTNQGNNLGYTLPFNLNKFSLMPKYKWIKAYLGDVNMSFSPYTLNGHPFRGAGLELTPRGAFKISMMGGKLLKAVETSVAASGVPVFERMGYASKLRFEKQRYKLEIIGFYAKDNINSLPSNFDAYGIKPKENIAGSLFVNTTFLKNIDFTIEYAISALNDDSRLTENSSIYKALKTNFNYNIKKTKLGLAYERVDPNYKTLGALFFNNDLENIAFTIAQPFYKDKISLSGNLGIQKDNLNLEKKESNKRIVGSVNLNYKPSEKLNFTGSYSNFNSYTNRRINQFDYINNPNLNPADTLDYRQLSQNATANMSYIFGKQKNQNITLNYNISGQANEQGGVIRRGQASTIQNVNVTHSIFFKTYKTGLNTTLNYTSNTVGALKSSIEGGSFNVSKKMFHDNFNSSLGLLYNSTKSNGNSNAVTAIRLNTSYMLFKKHNFTLAGIKMFKQASTTASIQDFTLNFNYSYSF